LRKFLWNLTEYPETSKAAQVGQPHLGTISISQYSGPGSGEGGEVAYILRGFRLG
jgi:hypothetical protein